MATPAQKVVSVELEQLKDVYRHREDRIKSICKAISQTLQTNIFVTVARNGAVRFEIVGRKIKQASRYIQDEFCIKKEVHSKRGGVHAQHGQFSRAARQVLPEQVQDKLLGEGNQVLLTEAALRKLDIATGVLQLREFACKDCDHVWWRTVPCTKPVAKCNHCSKKYDVLPREKEFGIGRFRCTVCKHSFFYRCEATDEHECWKCANPVKCRAPYIHPKFKPIRRRHPQHDRQMARPGDGSDPLVHLPRRKVINASKLHDSTGSTASTFITQTEYSVSIGAEAPEDIIIPDLMSDPESDEDVTVYRSSSDSDSDDQISIPQESEADRSDVETLVGSDSDSDDTYPKGPQKRLVASSSSDSSLSDPEQDAGKKASKAPSTHSSVDSDSASGKDSAQSSSKDSGLGTSLDTKSSAQTKSTDKTSDQGRPMKLGALASFMPNFPGIAFSKACAEAVVDFNGGTIRGEGIELTVPKFAVQTGDSVKIELQGCLGGPFKFPDGITPVSPVYRIAPPFIFQHEVILKMEHFAILDSFEDCNEMVFITSRTQLNVQEDSETPYWKFRVYHEARPECAPKSRYGVVRLRHFCFGALGRIFRQGQRNQYYVSLYSPKTYTPPCCDAIFSVSLNQSTYIQNLDRFVKNEYKGQLRLTCDEVESIDDKIELKVPTEAAQSQGYAIVAHKKCQIRKSNVEDTLKNKRHTLTDFITYPPRVCLTFQHLSDSPGALNCQLEFTGIEEVPYYTLYMPPYTPHSETSSERSSSFSEGQQSSLLGTDEEQAISSSSIHHILSNRDQVRIIKCLRHLSKQHCIVLGEALGLDYTKLLDMDNYPQDVVAAWLREEDNVYETCRPTWGNLAGALDQIGQTGIARKVRDKYLPS